MRRTWMLAGVLSLGLVTSAWAVKLRWDPPATGEPIGYTVYRGIALGQPCNAAFSPTMLLLDTTSVSVTTYTDPNPVVGANYFEITAFNSEGESLPSNRVCFQRQGAKTSQPLNLRFEP